MQGGYRVDEIEISWDLRVAVVGSPRAAYRILIELQRSIHS